ncbi:MAG: hypothetical protein KDA57_20710 [Planctomycetales bacterium]|nr:hypothetical protein [Planctomycetales bacterium]
MPLNQDRLIGAMAANLLIGIHGETGEEAVRSVMAKMKETSELKQQMTIALENYH